MNFGEDEFWGFALRSVRAAGIVALIAFTLVTACGTPARPYDRETAGSAGETPDSGGTNSSAGGSASSTAGGSGATPTSGSGGNAGEGGAAPDNQPPIEGGADATEGGAGPNDGSAGAFTQPDCAMFQTTCMGNAPATCRNGSWMVGAECSGALPACSNGVCASARVLGGIVTVAPRVGVQGAARVVNQSFEMQPTSCGLVGGQQVCVSGGIKP